MEREHRIRVLLAKLGFDGHDRGLALIATWLRNAGMEVIYLGGFRSPDEVVRSAISEDVDVVGLSFHNHQHMAYTPIMVAKLKEAGLGDVSLVLGGVIPKQDIPLLKDMGVDQIFTPGTVMEDIVAYLGKAALARAGAV